MVYGVPMGEMLAALNLLPRPIREERAPSYSFRLTVLCT